MSDNSGFSANSGVTPASKNSFSSFSMPPWFPAFFRTLSEIVDFPNHEEFVSNFFNL